MSSKLFPPLLALIVAIAFIFASLYPSNDFPIKVLPTPIPISPTPIAVNFNLESIILNFANKNWSQVLPSIDLSKADILLKSTLPPNDEPLDPSTLTQINSEAALINKMEIADAPQMRATYEALIKLCLAETRINHNFTSTLANCNYRDTYPKNYVWKDVDDITALAQVLPFAVTANYFDQQGEDDKSTFYWQQILTHHQALIDQYENIQAAGPDYDSLVTYAQDRVGESSIKINPLVISPTITQ